jgi:hypothetical protein
MITDKLQRRLTRVQRAKASLKDAVLERMVQLAHHLDIDKITISSLGRSCYWVGGMTSGSEALDEVQQFYRDHIDHHGLWGTWTAEKGWDVV